MGTQRLRLTSVVCVLTVYIARENSRATREILVSEKICCVRCVTPEFFSGILVPVRQDVETLLLHQEIDTSIDLQFLLAELHNDLPGRTIKKDRLLLYISRILLERQTDDADNKTIRTVEQQACQHVDGA